MKLIVLSPEFDFPNEAAAVTKLLDAGLAHFHLRKKSWDLEAVNAFLEQIPTAYHHRIAVHYVQPMIERINFHGIKPKADGRVISTSIHHEGELNASIHELKYAFLGPVFTSISKDDYHPVYGKNQFEKMLNGYNGNTDIIAIGGITFDKVEQCVEMGFDGVATIGAVWGQPYEFHLEKVVSNFKKFESVCQPFSHLC